MLRNVYEHTVGGICEYYVQGFAHTHAKKVVHVVTISTNGSFRPVFITHHTFFRLEVCLS